MSARSSPAIQERLLGVNDVVEFTLLQHHLDVPFAIDDAGRNDVTAAEIADDSDDFAALIVVIEAFPGPEIAFDEAAIPDEIGQFRVDDAVDIAAEFLGQLRKTIEFSVRVNGMV
jgi:hypothetical protein